MSIYNHLPYTYLIGWSQHDTWYYGVRYSATSSPNDLWKTYFTSSKHVKNFRKLHGEPDVIRVRRTFDSKEKATLWEHKVLRRMRVRLSDRWLNKNDCSTPPIMRGADHPLYGVGHSAESIEKMKKSSMGKLKSIPKSDDHRRKISEARKLNWAHNVSLRDSLKQKIGSKNANSKLSENQVRSMLNEYNERLLILPKVGSIGNNGRTISYIHEFSLIKSIEYKVSISAIKRILKGLNWKHIHT